ncbi:MAG: heme-binding domain-containing protein [Bacteriovorax sp.]|nr:heme-binding domain-containing protein [Bacteriovorax sp.]
MKTLFFSLILLSSFLTSCVEKQDKSTLRFHDPLQDKVETAQKLEAREIERKNFLLEKNRVWNEINTDAKESYKNIQGIVQNKCSSCHDSKSGLPFYGRIFKTINPVNHHQIEGLKSVDFANGFPFTAQGNPPQIAILKSIRNAMTERTMPLKVFTLVYPSKKINDEDEKKIVDWIDPVIEKLQDYDQRYNPSDANVTTQANKILELKCFRCHANGNNKGTFGSMENTQNLLKGKYVDLEMPDKSKLYTYIIQGKMPPSKLEALENDEMNTVRDWLELESKKAAKQEQK